MKLFNSHTHFLKNISHYKTFLTGLILAIGIIILSTASLLPALLDYEIKSAQESVLGINNMPSTLQLAGGETSRMFTSDTFKTDFEFNSIAPIWEEENYTDSRVVYLRISSNGRDWSQWLEIDAEGPLRDDDPNVGKVFPETPILTTGQYFQYRVLLWEDQVTKQSPVITDFRINYADSRSSQLQRIASGLADTFSSVFGGGVFAADQGPNIISRAGWGSPDPHGNKFKGTIRHWRPTYQPVEQVFLHHTVTDSYQSDPKAEMRAIWDYHTNTLGWGDIGYNYVVDSEGRIYEGRFGGDNVVAGHVYKYNRGSLGAAVLGCFQPGATCDYVNSGPTQAPSSTVIDSLSTLLSWKTTSFEINPTSVHEFCNLEGKECKQLDTISAHRDVGGTTCNGDLFYDEMSNIRNQVASKNSDNLWAYSAKQISYDKIVVKDESVTVSLTFKNTGTQDWSNSDNRLLLRVANPNSRESKLQGQDWINDSTIATLEEVSVVPGDTGTFTFQINRPDGIAGDFWEGIRLETESGLMFSNYFNLLVDASVAHPDGSLIQPAGSDRIYLVKDDKRQYVNSRAVFESNGFKWSQVRRATTASMDLPKEGSLSFREGTLLRGSEAPVYVVNYTGSGVVQKRHIVSRAIFDSLGYSSDDVINVHDSLLPAATGSAITSDAIHPDGTLIRPSGSPRVYILENQQRRYITSMSVFESYNFTSSQVKTATDGDKELSRVSDLPFREGALIKGSQDPVYVINHVESGSEKRHIVSRNIFEHLDFSFGEVLKVHDSLLPTVNGESVK
ncbi:MAG: N-acetylmuramoyl-L-alanine amidase [Candidatus Saccharimonadales bacterium]